MKLPNETVNGEVLPTLQGLQNESPALSPTETNQCTFSYNQNKVEVSWKTDKPLH